MRVVFFREKYKSGRPLLYLCIIAEFVQAEDTSVSPKILLRYTPRPPLYYAGDSGLYLT
jgi:hypothetical protein